jgi:hypothetical protein
MVSRQDSCYAREIQMYSDEVKYWYRRLDCVLVVYIHNM